MRIETHTPDRKVLANAIAEWIHEPVHYNGVPRCTYSIGPVTVERDGAISTESADAWATLMPFFENNGWLEQAQNQMCDHLESLTAEPEAEPNSKAEAAEPVTATCVSIPMGDATPENIVNLLRTLYARQKLINAMTQSDRLFIDEEVVTLLHDTETPCATGVSLHRKNTSLPGRNFRNAMMLRSEHFIRRSVSYLDLFAL